MGASRNGEKDLITFGRDSPRAALEALVSERNDVLTAPPGNVPFKNELFQKHFVKILLLDLDTVDIASTPADADGMLRTELRLAAAEPLSQWLGGPERGQRVGVLPACQFEQSQFDRLPAAFGRPWIRLEHLGRRQVCQASELQERPPDPARDRLTGRGPTPPRHRLPRRKRGHLHPRGRHINDPQIDPTAARAILDQNASALLGIG